MSYLDTLNEEQSLVVHETEGPKVVAASAGCISGDAIIDFSRDSIIFKMPIKNAYEYFNCTNLSDDDWDKSVKTYVRSLKSDEIRSHEIEGIVYSGKKEVYRLKLENGLEITATKCHRIMTKEGWIELGKLKDSNHVMIGENPIGYSKVLGVEYVGTEKTYDIQCKAPYHNFVANGMVIHNSGKTRVIIAKVIHLIKNKNILPNTIWVGTFTKKAKEELVERLSNEVGKEIAKKVKIGTLHSISFSIYKNGLLLVDNKHRTTLPRPLIGEGLAVFQMFNFIRSNEKKVHSRDGRGFLSSIGIRRMYGVNLENYESRYPFDKKEGSKWCHNRTVFEAWKYYEHWKIKNNWLDFADMLVRCLDMLENSRYSDYLKSLQMNCNYVLIDEAQDNNTINYRIAELLSTLSENITVVGDSRQAIYSFQGSSLNNLHDFIKRRKPKIYSLKTNYRSTKNLVDNGNYFIEGSKGIVGEPSIAFKDVGEPIKFCTSEDETGEASSVFNLVQDLTKNKGYKYKDIAILYRVHSQSVALESLFLYEDIPYITSAKNNFFDRKEIKDLIIYLKAFQNPDSLDFGEFKRIVGKPNRYISSKAVKSVESYCRYEGVTPWEALNDLYSINGLDKRNIMCFGEMRNQIISGNSKFRTGATVSDLIDYVLSGVGYENWLNGEGVGNKTQDSDVTMDFDALITLVDGFETVSDFFKYVEKIKEQEAVRKGKKDGDFIQMMTIHASKGKEFPVVITLGNCTRLAPFHRNEDIEEEKRLMYVALTRPEKELYVSVVSTKLGRFKVHPSPFLDLFKGGYIEHYGGEFQETNNKEG